MRGVAALGILATPLLLASAVSAQSLIEWVNHNTPAEVLAPTSPAQCEALQRKWDSLSRRISEEHSRCLQAQGRQHASPKGNSCSYAACEDAHVLMNDRSLVDKRRSQVNACLAAVREHHDRERAAEAKQEDVEQRFLNPLKSGQPSRFNEAQTNLSAAQKQGLHDWMNALNFEAQLNHEYEQALQKHHALQRHVKRGNDRQAREEQQAIEGGPSRLDQVKERYRNAKGQEQEAGDFESAKAAYGAGETAYKNRRLAEPKTVAKEFREGGRTLSETTNAIDDYWNAFLQGAETVETKGMTKMITRDAMKAVGKQAIKEVAVDLVGGAVGLADPPPQAGEPYVSDNPRFAAQQETQRRQERERAEAFVLEAEGERLHRGGTGITIPSPAAPWHSNGAELRANTTPPSLYTPLGEVKGWVVSNSEVSQTWPFIDPETRQMGRITKERASPYLAGQRTCTTLRIEVFGRYDTREEICE